MYAGHTTSWLIALLTISRSRCRYHSDSGSTILPRRSGDMTVAEILKQTLRRRGLRYGEYLLERSGDIGVRLDLNTTLAELEDSAGGPVEFVLIRKFSEMGRVKGFNRIGSSNYFFSPPQASAETMAGRSVCRVQRRRRSRTR